jgi:hypothetical protein
VASAIAFGFALVLVGLRSCVVGRYRVRTPSTARPLPVGACAARRAQPWGGRGRRADERLGPRPTVFRIASAVPSAVRRPCRKAHRPWRRPAGGTKGRFRPNALISTSTSGTIARALSNGRRPSPRTELLLNELLESLNTFRAARYGRNGQLDTASLDAFVERAPTL